MKLRKRTGEKREISKLLRLEGSLLSFASLRQSDREEKRKQKRKRMNWEATLEKKKQQKPKVNPKIRLFVLLSKWKFFVFWIYVSFH